MDNNITIYYNNGIFIGYQKNRIGSINYFEHRISIQYYGERSWKSDCHWLFTSEKEQDIIITNLRMCIDFLDRNVKNIIISPRYNKKKHIINMLKKDLELELNPAQGILNRIRGV